MFVYIKTCNTTILTTFYSFDSFNPFICIDILSFWYCISVNDTGTICRGRLIKMSKQNQCTKY